MTERDLFTLLLHPNLRLFRAGVVATALSGLLAFTPVHWWIERALWGVEDHFYPEIFWMVTALPLSLPLVVGGLVSAWMSGPEPERPPRAPRWGSGDRAGRR